MQVMPQVHAKRYETYGGKMSAFDAMTNMRVGVEILIDCVALKKGSLMEGLKFYFGGDGANEWNGGDYVSKVLTEQERLDFVARNQPLPPTTATASTTPASTASGTTAPATAASDSTSRSAPAAVIPLVEKKP